MVKKYNYLSARVRAMKGKLLDSEDYQQLLRMETNEIAEFLERSDYQDEIDDLGIYHDGKKLVELALMKDLIKKCRKLVKVTYSDARDVLDAYLLRYDVRNLKKVIRWKCSDEDERMPQEEIKQYLTSSPNLSEDVLESFLKEDMRLQSVFDVIAKEIPVVTEDIDIDEEELDLEAQLDRNYYSNLISVIFNGSSDNQVVRKFLKRKLDLINLTTIVRMKCTLHDPETIEKHLVLPEESKKVGTLQCSELKSFIDMGCDNLVDRLRKMEIGKYIPEDYESLEEVENALKKYNIDIFRKLYFGDPLTIGPILGYVMAKEIEVDNLRSIVRGKELDLSKEEIEKRLLVS